MDKGNLTEGSKQLRPRARKTNTRRFLRCLRCCTCLQPAERKPSLEQQQSVQKGSSEAMEDMENVHIILEDLGMDNPSFSQSEPEEGSSGRGSAVGRSTSSVSDNPTKTMRKKKKKGLVPLSSLPLRLRTAHGSLNGEEDLTLLSTGSTADDGSLLRPPVINLIPPTPSDVVDDEQFFDVNSEEESLALTSGSECVDSVGSSATGDEQESEEEEDRAETEEFDSQVTEETDKQPEKQAENQAREGEEKPAAFAVARAEEMDRVTKESKVERVKPNFLQGAFQAAPLLECPHKRSFNTGISLLQFTEHNLDDLSNKDANSHDFLKAELRILPFCTKMEASHLRKPTARTCSLGEMIPRSHTFHTISQSSEDTPEDEGSPRQRRVTIASYMPQSKDQNGNFAGKNSNGHRPKPLSELDTEEVCQWFCSIGLEKCLPLIRGSGLCGSHIATIDLQTLDVLQVSSLEEREALLSAIYQELHPPNTTTQRLDSLLETFGPNNVEKFTAALVSMSKSRSSPNVSCVNVNRCSNRFRHQGQGARAHRAPHLIEITINASERIVHLRTTKDTTVGKVMESSLKMLGMTDDKNDLILKNTDGPSDGFSPDHLVGDLPGSENRLVELHLCKKEKQRIPDSPDSLAGNGNDNMTANQNEQNTAGKIRELNQQVDALQNVILQVQELHHGLVAFCSELKSAETEMDMDGLESGELRRRLKLAQGRLQEKRHSVQALRDSLSAVSTHKHKRAEARLVEKMKLNCQVFKEEISVVHLTRQVAHLSSVLEEKQEKVRLKAMDQHLQRLSRTPTDRAEARRSTLSRLVSLQSPAMLVAVLESQVPGGSYGFRARLVEGQGLLVVEKHSTSLCVNDRLVEVNGVSVLGSSEEELGVLLQERSAHIIVLRRPPPPPPPPLPPPLPPLGPPSQMPSRPA